MKISKVIPESSIDYPEKFGPVFFVSGCNFQCGFCHNPELKRISEENLNYEEILKSIRIKTAQKWYNGACISGGEPTLHNEIFDFCKKLKNFGLSVKIDTNGTNPDVLKRLLEENLVDYVAMDIKGPKELYPNITSSSINIGDIEKSIKILSSLPSKRYEFRTTIVPIIDYINKEVRFINKEEVENMARWVQNITKHKDSKWYLQKFVSRPKGEIMHDDFSIENLPNYMRETPDETLDSLKAILERFFVAEMR